MVNAAPQELPLDAPFVLVEVDDPYSSPYADKVERRAAVRSLRGDPLGWLYAHKQFGLDEAQYLAGRLWQWLHERAELGAVQAVDTTREPVDGGGKVHDPITDAQRAAILQLRQAERALLKSSSAGGERRVRLVSEILGLGLFPAQTSVLCGSKARGEVSAVVNEFLAALDVLVTAFGLANREGRRLSATALRPDGKQRKPARRPPQARRATTSPAEPPLNRKAERPLTIIRLGRKSTQIPLGERQ